MNYVINIFVTFLCPWQNLEKQQLELENLLEEFEALREQFGLLEDLENLNEARDAVRRHVEAKQRLGKEELDVICEKVSHVIARTQPCDNPDFQGWIVTSE